MTDTGIDTSSVEELSARLKGTVIRPGDADYDEARALYNAMIDKRPALIVRAAGVDDVVAAVNYGRSTASTSRSAAAVTTAQGSRASTTDS